MRRAIVPLAILLALASGVVLAETRRIVLVPAVALGGDPRGPASAEVVRRFYAAVNEVLRTGDAADLDGIVAADLVDHAAHPGDAADRAGFLGSLKSLRTTAPSLRLAVLDVVAQGDRVAARVRVEGGEGAAFVGLPVATAHLWGNVDVFRVEAGRVIEHWGDPTGQVLLRPLAAATTTLAGSPWKVVTLERRTYAPGATVRELAEDGPTLVWIEAGRLTVEVDHRSPASAVVEEGAADGFGSGRPVRPGDRVTLRVGDAIAVPPAVPFTSRNDEREPTVVVAITIGLPVVVDAMLGVSGSATEVSGITTEVLAGGSAAPTPIGLVTFALGRATLAPGAALPEGGAVGTEVVAVAAGRLALAVPVGKAWVRVDGGRSVTASTYQELAAGQAATVAPGAVVSYRNDGTEPLVLLVVTLVPAPAGLALSQSSDG